MERRELLKHGLALTAGAMGARQLPALASQGPANRLVTLASGLNGRVVTEADARYGMLSQPWNAQFANVRPLAVVLAADETDVASTIAFAREEQLDFVVRGGGHSFEGFSASQGIVISRVVGGRHFKADLTLPFGRVVHDYLD